MPLHSRRRNPLEACELSYRAAAQCAEPIDDGAAEELDGRSACVKGSVSFAFFFPAAPRFTCLRRRGLYL